ncbi:ATP-dependent DNA ligase [Rathayibacter rathayi]|uniref:ATP-dependent DNA ligase n=1 Tax=Rathayibacter rathayi TaxID=33887 RepID=A0ABD6W530_RATRA|nr:ATP-dependent DNA ligase [Rathayibacter rathayi]AZZ49883.1 ATP-dependent DNA ligase [Rathayibacter rathayi]MWV75954.1 ATP-dependent DNA ligase [Rathayibacter rathayi NCPPB 2980 = VKM Ac-1601]PPF09577.1 ATP-dependent DNA ligase [Rathayibacter rathayi]PPF18156.1 ATP-dependent DNA ligase [Rathayibacter rathayi]PPF41682.1 ATP-dependent DNA ligase [Rathayibacter rathayi]
MGKLYYDGTVEIDFEDRVLAHLQIVITAKLRRNESFLLSWRDDHSMGDGRSAIWLHPSHALRYKYFGGRMPRINPAWIAALTDLANSAGGLYVISEPAEPVRPPIKGEQL